MQQKKKVIKHFTLPSSLGCDQQLRVSGLKETSAEYAMAWKALEQNLIYFR